MPQTIKHTGVSEPERLVLRVQERVLAQTGVEITREVAIDQSRGDICALQKIRSLAKRSNCTRRARTTLSRMSDELSPGASLCQLFELHRGNIDMNIYSIEQRAGEL